MSNLDTVLQRFGRQRVLVLGDMVADEYVLGRPARISREAPVLILHHTENFVRPGGATNPACNISALGASACVVGVIGDDEMGRRLKSALDALKIDTSGLIVDPNRATSTKTRIVGKGTQEVQQQIVRIDRVDTHEVDGRLRDRMIDAACRVLPDMHALLISDYENGVISQEVIEACLPLAERATKVVTVDSHGDLFRFKGVTAATPNQPEAESTIGRPFASENDLDTAGAALLEGMGAKGVLITRGSEGIALFERGQKPYKLPVSIAEEHQVVDPTGAGDTVAAVFTLALTTGASMRLGAFLGNVAGGEVVRRLGAATISRDQLSRAARATSLAVPE